MYSLGKGWYQSHNCLANAPELAYMKLGMEKHVLSEKRKGNLLCILLKHLHVRTGNSVHFSSVQSHSCVQLLETPWTAARQASLSITNSRSPPKPMSIELVIPSNHLILCRPLLLPSIFPSIRVFSNESVLCIRWPKYWSFSFSISLSNEHPRTDLL